MRLISFLIVCALVQPVCAVTEHSDIVRGRLGQELDSVISRLADEGYSGSVLIARKGEIVLQKGYGLADRKVGVQNTPATLFNVASVAKVFTATAILQLEERGKLSTNDRIDKYLGAFPKEKNEATIHHLLTHTSGLVVKGAPLDYTNRKAFIQSVRDTPVASPPGSYQLGLRKGTYWGIRTNIADYKLPTSMNCPFEVTTELANTATRLKKLNSNLQERIINWGYAVCDAAIRTHLDSSLIQPPVFPYPETGI